MSAITKNISLNIYEPENNLKYLKDTKKKSIITKIIKSMKYYVNGRQDYKKVIKSIK